VKKKTSRTLGKKQEKRKKDEKNNKEDEKIAIFKRFRWAVTRKTSGAPVVCLKIPRPFDDKNLENAGKKMQWSKRVSNKIKAVSARKKS